MVWIYRSGIMDYTEINQLLDDAIAIGNSWAAQLAAKDQQIASRDDLIASLQSQLATVQATSDADEDEVKTLHDKLLQFSALFAQQPDSDQSSTEPAAS